MYKTIYDTGDWLSIYNSTKMYVPPAVMLSTPLYLPLYYKHFLDV